MLENLKSCYLTTLLVLNNWDMLSKSWHSMKILYCFVQFAVLKLVRQSNGDVHNIPFQGEKKEQISHLSFNFLSFEELFCYIWLYLLFQILTVTSQQVLHH